MKGKHNMPEEYSALFKAFKKNKVLVIGDVMLDVYLQGSCSRIAPEASVPVIDLTKRKTCLGGAGNVVANLKALGAEVYFLAVTGDDEHAGHIQKMLQELGISDDLMIRDHTRKTLSKTRVNSDSQTIVRIDEGTTSAVSSTTTQQLCNVISKYFDQVDAVLVSDYDKGVVTSEVINHLERLNKTGKKVIAVDAKALSRYVGLSPDFIKPNYQEAAALAAAVPDFLNRKQQVAQWGKLLHERTAAKHIALTMDSDGVAYFEQGNFRFHQNVPQVDRPSVSGAGDTFLAAGLMALVAGAPAEQVMEIAASAACCAIQEEHTAVCSLAALQLQFSTGGKLLENNEIINAVVAKYKQMGKRVVFTNGCFDILHSGHVSYLKGAKKRGDVLIVGLNNDESIRRLKGLQRPINKLNDRIEVLSELSCIDHIIPFGKQGDDTPIAVLKKIKPHVFVKGGDYKHKFLPEEQILKKFGCEIVFLPMVANQSTTNVISKIQENSTFATVNGIN
jgi:D-beta-D-heptose 7-phosphate kinase/D-beta-D-heptose 1-phosphate adenosyltransferase